MDLRKTIAWLLILASLAAFWGGACSLVVGKPVVVPVAASQVTAASVGSDGVTWTINFSKGVTGNSGFTVTASGGACTLGSPAGSGSTRTYTGSRTIEAGETLTLAYTPGDISRLGVFSGFSVTNSSVQGAPPPTVPDTEPLLAAANTQIIADEGSANFTPTLTAGSDVTYSFANLPTGASGNTSTGAITGTLSTTGRWLTKITAANTDGTDYIYVPFVVYATSTDLTQAAVNSSNKLTGAYTRFRLTENITVVGNAIYLCSSNITLDLNGFTLTYGGAMSPGTTGTVGATECGVISYVSFHNTEVSPAVTGASSPTNCSIINGTIASASSANKSHAIYAYRTYGLMVEDVTATVDGSDSHTVYIHNHDGDTGYVLNSLLTSTTEASLNRHAGPANIGGQGTAPILNIERNVLIGGNSAVRCNLGSVVRKNVLGHDGHVTNGYGVWIYQSDNCTVADNLILPSNGRGVLLNGASGSGAGIQEGNSITNNVILHWEEPNAEFGGNLNPPALRSRYQTGGNTFSGNTCLGIAGTGLTSASTLYLTDYGTAHYANVMEDNLCMTICVGTPAAAIYAQPLTMEGQGNITYGGSPDIIRNNTFHSNLYQVRVEGYDGFAQQAADITGNELEWITGNTADTAFASAIDDKIVRCGLLAAVDTAADSYIATIKAAITAKIGGVGLQATRALWYSKFISHAGTETYADLIDSTFNSVDSQSYTYQFSSLSTGSVSLREGFTDSIQLLDGMTPLASVNVTVTSDQGDEDTYTTDGSGNVTITFYRYALEKADGSGAAFALTTRTQSTLTPVGYQPEVVLHSSIPATLDFDP